MKTSKEQFIRMFNDLKVKDMAEVKELYELKGDFINLEYTLPSGQKVKLWDDNEKYYGAQICKPGSERCYGLVASDEYILVCEYGNEGTEAEIIVFQKLDSRQLS